MTFEDFQKTFIEWVQSTIEPKKDDGWPVCPYARKARINNEIQFLDGRDTTNTLEVLGKFDDDTYKMAVCWMDDDCDLQVIDSIVSQAEIQYPTHYFFASTETSGFFVQNFTRIIIVQIKDDIRDRRSKLKKTSYYDSWPEHYYRSVVKDD